MYSSLGRWCYRHPWRVLIAWGLIIVIAAGASGSLGSAYGGTPAAPDAESSRGADILDEHFGRIGAVISGRIVFRAEQGVNDPAVQAAMTELFERVKAIDGVTVGSPYDPNGVHRIAAQGPEAGRIAYADVDTGADTSAFEAEDIGIEIGRLIDEVGLRSMDGVQVEVGGAWLSDREPPESETIGLAFAVFVLILAVGSVVAMGMTVGTALIGVGVGAAGVVLLSNVATVPEFAPTIGIMIGIGVGIDYALFIITRYREWVHGGLSAEEATAAALDSAGRAVIFAGATVVVSLLGLLLIGLPFVAGLGLAAAITVTVVMAGSVTLLPAVIGLLGDRITTTRFRGVLASALVAVALLGFGTGFRLLLVGVPLAAVVLVAGSFKTPSNLLRRVVRQREPKPRRETGWYRLSRMVQSRPWLFAVGGTVVLLVLAAPVLGLRLGFSDEGNFAEETTTRRAYDLISEGFGPGANGPLIVVAESSPDPGEIAALRGLSEALNRTEGVAFASPPIANATVDAFLIRVQPTTGPQDAATEDLVHRMRDDVIPPALDGTGLDPLVAGQVAFNIDISDYLAGRIPVFFAAVLGASFLLLMAVFRSLVVPLKAVIMNMLSIGAAYGVVVAVFQWGWLGGLTGVEPAPIEPFIPMMLFAILFGLSMDYEVFLLSRMKEEYERTGDAVNSVADGLAATARVITAAAAIMVVVFGSFVLEDSRPIKLFGLGLATAIAIDATLVRMLIVPSTMELLGARNWWLPRWLDRIIPNLRVEGELADRRP
ncbi:MAG: MMPL family transporter [Acidimicrobiaceae bacterium]|nr:MMPL family transporter [Acidimicrobiaceae bacterium]